MIEITFPNGGKRYFYYLEDIAEFLTRWYGREVLVSDYEGQLESLDCDFIIFGDKYHYCQTERDNE